MIQPPRTLLGGVKLMCLGAALTLFGVVFSVLNTGPVHASIVNSNTKRAVADRLTPAQIETIFHGRVITAAVIGVLGALLWVAMAVFNRRGRTWARYVASGLCAFSVISFLYTASAVLSQGGGQLGLAVSALNVAIGVGAIVLIWRHESSDYYEARMNEGEVATQ
ncbi:hypothetical protein V3G39_13025 [Dermatophilaceae bacterium Sec6.4]